MRVFFKSIAICAAMLGLCSQSQAADGKSGLAAYTFEVAPVIGKNLPYDLYGTPGTFNSIGLRLGYNLPGGYGVAEGGATVLHNDPDRAYVYDLGYRYELSIQGLNGFFSVGAHYSRYKLVVDGRDDPPNGLTDSGNYFGYYFGGGFQVPLAPKVPLKLGMRYYFHPQYSLLLELGVGFRY